MQKLKKVRLEVGTSKADKPKRNPLPQRITKIIPQ